MTAIGPRTSAHTTSPNAMVELITPRPTSDVVQRVKAATGFDDSAALMAEHGETPDPDEAGTLGNSAVRTDSAALGLSWIGERGFVGGSYSLFNTAYGIPGGHAHEGEEDGHEEEHEGEHAEDEGAEHGDEDVRIVMDQRRNELRAGLDDLGPFASLRSETRSRKRSTAITRSTPASDRSCGRSSTSGASIFMNSRDRQ